MSRQSDLAEAQCAEDGGCTPGPENRCSVCGQATTPPRATSYDEYLITQAGGDGDPLDAIQRRADAASEGPWDAARGANANGTTYANSREDKAIFLAASLNNNRSALWLVASDTVIPAATGDGPRAKANAEFIAHARTDVPALLTLARKQAATLAAVLELANARGRNGWSISSDEIRKALKA